MLAVERRNEIIKILNKNSIIKVNELKKEFDVTKETIRRDLESLEKENKLKRVYGGAVPLKKGVEPEYEYRKIKNLKEKKKIAAKTLQYIENGDTIIIDIGTTTLELAKLLSQKNNLFIITNSLKIALEIDLDKHKVYILGGELRKGEFSSSGYLTQNNLKNFNVDKTIMGIGGISLEKGITDYNIEESFIRREMIKISKEIIGLADYSKFGVNALTHVCDLKEMDLIITDDNIDKKILDQYSESDIKLVIAAD